MNSYLDVLKKYAEFGGRATRTEYWMFALINTIVAIGLAIVDGIVGTAPIIGLVYALAVFIPGLAVTVRRLHDIGKSGATIFIVLIPIVGLILLLFMVRESDAGANQYGS